MADKEATVYVVDVGMSMGRKNHGRQQSDLDWAMRYVWDKITSTVSLFCWKSGHANPNPFLKVALERKTATLGVIGLKTVGMLRK